MAKPDPIVESLPIARQTTVEWECPFCGNANGIPEITVCACGASRDGSTVTAGRVSPTAFAADPAATYVDDSPADTGE